MIEISVRPSFGKGVPSVFLDKSADRDGSRLRNAVWNVLERIDARPDSFFLQCESPEYLAARFLSGPDTRFPESQPQRACAGKKSEEFPAVVAKSNLFCSRFRKDHVRGLLGLQSMSFPGRLCDKVSFY